MRRRRHAMITPQAATTSDALLEALLDARRVELALLDDLTDAQMLGTRAHFVEPPIWEMGHVGWFQEYWLLRRLDGADPLLPGADDVYDSFNVSYTRRWDHRFPSRASTRAYITEVLRRSVARLESREPRGDDAYFYTLAALHEDMHGENLTAILQTLGYARPASLGSTPAPAPPVDPGFRPRDVRHQRGVPGLRRRRRLSASRVLGTARLGLAPPRGRRASGVLAARRRSLVRAPLRPAGAPRAVAPGRARELVRGGGVLPLGGPAAPHRGGVGDGGHARPGHGPQAAFPLGRRAADARARQSRLPCRRNARRARAAGRRQSGRLPADDRQRVGVGGRHVPAVSRVRVRPVQGVFRAAFRPEERAQGRMLDDAFTPDPGYVAQFLQAAAAQRLRRLPDRGALTCGPPAAGSTSTRTTRPSSRCSRLTCDAG